VSKPDQEDGARIVWLIGEVYRLSRRWTEEVVRKEGITATQLSILKRIEFFPDMSRAELARASFITSQAAQVAITTLEERGLVTARPAKNSRAVRSQLTAKGRKVLKACHDATEPVLERLVAPLGNKDRKPLINLLTTILEEHGLSPYVPPFTEPRRRPSSR
jgi:DNA-binding MarR family transcriptional regulator